MKKTLRIKDGKSLWGAGGKMNMEDILKDLRDKKDNDFLKLEKVKIIS